MDREVYKSIQNAKIDTKPYEDWEYCVVEPVIVNKQRFGLFSKDSVTLGRWAARRALPPYPSRGEAIVEKLFTADMRQGEDFNDLKASALGDLLLELTQDGWELMGTTDPHAEAIFLCRPRSNQNE